MLWYSFRNREQYTGFDGSDFSNGRGLHCRHRSSAMSSHSDSEHHQRTWIDHWPWNMLTHRAKPERGRKHKLRKMRKGKAFFWKHFRPQSSQEWGLMLLAILLFIYLVDFLSLLYTDDQSKMSISRSNSMKSSWNKNLRPFRNGRRQSSEKAINVRVSGNVSKLSTAKHVHGGDQTDGLKDNRGTQKRHPVSESHSVEDQFPADEVSKPLGHPRNGLPLHPMNRNMPELQVREKTGILPEMTVKSYYRKLAQAFLSSFKNGIYRQMYFDILRRRTYSLTPPGANKGVQAILFQIINGKVYMMDPYEVPRNSKPFYRTRINQVIWLLSKLVKEKRIKNTEFLLAIHDCVQTVNKQHSYRGAHFQESNPAFTIVTCNFSDNIPFPMWEGSKYRDGGFSGWDERTRLYAADDIEWERKQDRAVFRGGNRPSMFFLNKSEADFHCHEVGRTRLQYISRQHPDVLDVSIGGTCGGVRSVLDRLEPRDHHRYKYILYAEGNCMWADRIRTQLFGPSTIIKQETPCGQFFEPLLKPNTHYVPTDFFFTDTVSRVLWARRNDDKAKEIVRNAKEFANNFLTLKGIENYVEVLLEEYTKLLVEPDIKLENGAIDVTSKRV